MCVCVCWLESARCLEQHILDIHREKAEDVGPAVHMQCLTLLSINNYYFIHVV